MKGTALGFDLGLNTGWAVVQRVPGRAPSILASGNVDVRAEEGLSARLLRWHHEVAIVVHLARDRGASCVAYEQIRRMQGQGARYILMQEGILNVDTPHKDLPILGIPDSSLRSHAGKKKGMTWAARAIPVFANPSIIVTEDQAVAAFAAHYLLTHGTLTEPSTEDV